MTEVGNWIADILDESGSEAAVNRTRAKVEEICRNPAYQFGWARGVLRRITDGRTAEARWADEARAAELAKAPS